MKKVVVLLVCAVVLLVGDTVLDKSDIESSFDAKKACDSGEMHGCFNLGVMYADGDGVEKNEQKAAELYKKACDGGDMDGCRNLAIMYEKGKVVEKDLDKAADLYKKVCDNNIKLCADILFFALDAN